MVSPRNQRDWFCGPLADLSSILKMAHLGLPPNTHNCRDQYSKSTCVDVRTSSPKLSAAGKLRRAGDDSRDSEAIEN